MKNSSGLIIVEAKLKMFNANEGGRAEGFKSGLRPNHIFEYSNGEPQRTFIGDIHFNHQELIMPGEENEVLVRFIDDPLIRKYIRKGQKWYIHEGAKCSGKAEILKIK